MTIDTYDVFTVGGIEFLSQAYKILVMITGDSEYETLWRLFMVFGLIGITVSFVFKQMFSLFFSRIVTFFFMAVIFIGMKVNINIIDTQLDKTYLVSNVPVSIGYPHYMFSTISTWLVNKIDNSFHIGTVEIWDPMGGGAGRNAWGTANLDYAHTGYGGMADTILLIKKLNFKNMANKDVRSFDDKLNAFLVQCVMPEIGIAPQVYRDKYYQSNDLMAAINPTVNQFFTYNGVTTTCVEFYNNDLYPMWTDTIAPMFDNPVSNMLSQIGIKPSQVPSFRAAFTETLKIGSIALSNQIAQGAMIYAMDYAAKEYISDPPGSNAATTALLYEMNRNIQQSDQTGKAIGLYIMKVTPYYKTILESLSVIMIIFLNLIIFLPGRHLKMFAVFLESVAGIYALDPILALLDGFVKTSIISRTYASLEAAGSPGGMNIQALESLSQTLDFVPAVAGYLAMSAPVIALAFIKTGELAAIGAISSMAGAAQSSMTRTPPHEQAGSDAAKFDVASKTGKSFGDIEWSVKNPAGLAEMVGRTNAYDKFGAKSIADSTANTFAGGIGGGSAYQNMDTAFKTGEIKTKRDVAGAGAYSNYVNDKFGGDFRRAADMEMADNRAMADVFKTPENLEGFLENTKELNVGQQNAMIRAAAKAGVDLSNYAEQSAYVEQLNKIGLVQDLQSGKITEDEFIQRSQVEARYGIENAILKNDIAKALPRGFAELVERENTGILAGTERPVEKLIGVEGQKLSEMLGKQELDTRMAGYFGFVNDDTKREDIDKAYNSFYTWDKGGRVADDNILGVLKKDGINYIEKGMSLAFNVDAAGKPVNVTGILDEPGRRVIATAAGTVEETRRDGITTTTTKDSEGKLVGSQQKGVIDLDTAGGKKLGNEIGKNFKDAKVFDNQKVEIDRGPDGSMSVARLQKGADSSEFDTYNKRTGREEKKMDNVLEEKRREKIETNLSTISSGTVVSGSPGVTTYERDAALFNAFNGDLTSANKLVTGSESEKLKQRIQEGKDFVRDIQPIIDKHGLKFSTVQAEGSFGVKAFGLGVSKGQSDGKTDQTSINALYTSYTSMIKNAEDRAQRRGLTAEQAVAQDRKAFAEALINEAEGKEKGGKYMTPDGKVVDNKKGIPQS
ncbi:MAG: conjugal transfer protein TraG N-terminal domain-containing protein [Nitrospinae bacterium]|nr:conjugal transfer protein TraG N-terminal domain-containing protein [Nitrospinota bacterium]